MFLNKKPLSVLILLFVIIFFLPSAQSLTISCDIPSNVESNSYINFNCLLDETKNFLCLVKVSQGGRLISVSPDYKTFTNPLISLNNQRVEDREYFTAQNGLLNAYFENKDLLTDTVYDVSVTCADNSTTAITSNSTTLFYGSPSGVVNRTIWAKNNATYLLYLVILLLLLIMFLGWAYKRLKGGGSSR